LNNKARAIFISEEKKSEASENNGNKTTDQEDKRKNQTIDGDIEQSSKINKIDIVQFIHSKVFNDNLHQSADNYINSFTFVLSCLKEYTKDSSAEQSYTDEKTKLKEKQVWPYILVHL